ncbi:MAG TPA: hypothetical protein VJ343_00645 [archaeon]|nr:hypothetical protein [archaeon]
MKKTPVRWKCGNCSSIYDNESQEGCPMCGSSRQSKVEGEISEIEEILNPKANQKYISRYKKGRPVLKRKK